MPHDTRPLRHAQLFELLRQQSLSESTATRLRARSFARAQLDHQDAQEICAQAVSSWQAA